MKRVVCFITALMLVALLVVGTALSVYADSSNLAFTVYILDDPDHDTQGNYVNFYVKGSANGTLTTYGPYHDGQSSVLTADFFSVMTLEAGTIPSSLGYTGCTIRVYTAGFGADITGDILGLSPINGEYYVDFGVDVTLNNTNQGQSVIFSISAINWPAHVSQTSGYDKGVEDGIREGYRRCLEQKYNPLKEQYDILYEAYQEALRAAGQDEGDQISVQAFEAALAAARLQGFNDGVAQSDVVPKLVAGSITSTGNLINQVLSFSIFGVPIYVMLSLFLVIPITIFAIKLFAKHGG